MKLLNLIIISTISFSTILISCTKEDEETNNNVQNKINTPTMTLKSDGECGEVEGGYIFCKPDWKLIEESIVIEGYGEGNLYINKNNEIEEWFNPYNPNIEAFDKAYSKDPLAGSESCTGSSNSCSISIQRNAEDEITGIRIYH